MPDFGIYAGDTSKTVYVRLRDSTTGLGQTGLVFDSAGAVASYTLPVAARAAITLATLASASAAWSSGGFILVDDTNAKGLYRLDLPDAAIASGSFTVISIEFDGIIEESMVIPLHTPKVNVTEWLGTAAATPTVGGVPEVDVTHVGGATTNVSALATNVDAILTDTNELQSDDIPTTLATLATTADLLDKLGAVNEAAAAGDPSATESVMQYVKQIVNVLEGTDGITTIKAAAAPASGVSLSEMIRSIYDDSNSLDGTKIPDTISLANINAEVDTALDTAISELGVAAPTATPTVRTALMLMYMALRNRTDSQTSGTDALEIYNDAGTLIAKKLLTDAGGDYSEAKMVSG